MLEAYFVLICLQGLSFEIEYQVLEGGDLDIDFTVYNPTGNVILEEKRSEDGLHEVASSDEGDYKVCND